MKKLPLIWALILYVIFWITPGPVHGDCVWNRVDEDRIDCSLRILDFRRNSSDVPGVKRVRSFNVECSDVFFFESQLRSDHFGSLPHLQELSIKFCKIRQLPPRLVYGLSAVASAF